eukprot:m.86071 g.86071  ORF g.86071 m.86071 type:complete len:86 (+) comp19817_c0_seq1:247-504(+)
MNIRIHEFDIFTPIPEFCHTMESGARRRDARFGDDEKPKEGPPISKTYNHKIPESKYANFQIYIFIGACTLVGLYWLVNRMVEAT